jgi:hypothetical protein
MLVPVSLTFCGTLPVKLVTVLLLVVVSYLLLAIALVPFVTLLIVLLLAISASIALKYRTLTVLIQVTLLVNALLHLLGIGIQHL